MSTKIYCCGCEKDVSPRFTTGEEIYAHRPDLFTLHFWKCNECKNYVGCHKHTNKPLGCIPTYELRTARKHIHLILDPLWKSKRFKRKVIYSMISRQIGIKYHTANTRTVEECRNIYRIIKKISNERSK